MWLPSLRPRRLLYLSDRIFAKLAQPMTKPAIKLKPQVDERINELQQANLNKFQRVSAYKYYRHESWAGVLRVHRLTISHGPLQMALSSLSAKPNPCLRSWCLGTQILTQNSLSPYQLSSKIISKTFQFHIGSFALNRVNSFPQWQKRFTFFRTIRGGSIVKRTSFSILLNEWIVSFFDFVRMTVCAF